MYKPHPLAEIFPPMSEDEMKALVDDIKTSGLVDPIILYEGKILDGVHRQKACVTAKIEPKYQEWKGEGGSPIAFVWSKNWNRRTLTPSQRAAVAISAEAEFAKEGKDRMSEGGKSRGSAKSSQPFRARNEAAQLANVSPAYVQLAKAIQQADPKILEQVRLGQITLSKAKKEAKITGKQKEHPTHIKISRKTIEQAKYGFKPDDPSTNAYLDTVAHRASIICPHLRFEKYSATLFQVVADKPKFGHYAAQFPKYNKGDLQNETDKGKTFKLEADNKKARVIIEDGIYIILMRDDDTAWDKATSVPDTYVASISLSLKPYSVNKPYNKWILAINAERRDSIRRG